MSHNDKEYFQYNSQNELALKQRDEETFDETMIAINQAIDETGSFFRTVRREAGFNFIMIIVIIVILTCAYYPLGKKDMFNQKIKVSDYKKEKWQYGDDLELIDNDETEVSTEELINLMSEYLKVASIIYFFVLVFLINIFRKSYIFGQINR